MQALTHADASPASRWMPTLLATVLVMLCFTLVLLSFSRPDYRRFAQVAEGLDSGFGRAGALGAEPVPRRASPYRWTLPGGAAANYRRSSCRPLPPLRCPRLHRPCFWIR
jgi:hypothetical protein